MTADRIRLADITLDAQAWHTAAMAALDNTTPRQITPPTAAQQIIADLTRDRASLHAALEQARADRCELAQIRDNLTNALEDVRAKFQDALWTASQHAATAKNLRDANDGLTLTLAEILGRFRVPGGPGNRYYVRTDWIPAADVDRWRRALNDADPEQARDDQDDTRAALNALDTWGQTWHRRRRNGATPAQPADIALLAAYDAIQGATAPAPGSATRAEEPAAVEPGQDEYHWSRAWGPVSTTCGCAVAPCGYIVRGGEAADCDEHGHHQTMRGGHPASRCPGGDR